MKYALILLAVLLAGCETNPSKPTIIEVPVKCKTEDPQQPTYRYSPPYTDVFQGTRDLLGDREVALAYEAELRTALKSCK